MNSPETFRFITPDFLDRSSLEKEERRIYDICNGCRLCFNLCPSFPSLFSLYDEVDNEGEKIPFERFEKVEEVCFQCKVCYMRCPYTPPHHYMLDFPRLMLRARAFRAKEKGISFTDKVLGNTDLMGKVGSFFAPLANLTLRIPFMRGFMEKTIGIHRRRLLPTYASRTFLSIGMEMIRKARVNGSSGKALLFYTCTVNYNRPDIGKAALEVLLMNDVSVELEEFRCCGMPYLDGGDLKSATNNARHNLIVIEKAVKGGYDIIGIGPTCTYVIKEEYPLLLPESKEILTGHVFDIGEYLLKLKRAGKLNTNFKAPLGQVAYHLPCHLRAQNVGAPFKELLSAVPGTEMILIEQCSGIDGTWGLKRQYYDMANQVAVKLIDKIKDFQPSIVLSDCPLASLQIEEGTGRRPIHPVQALLESYGEGR